MRILAIETSDRQGNIAALNGERLVCGFELETVQRTAQSLVPAIGHVLKHIGWQPKHVQLVGVSAGPGSFTGLRIGVVTAKTFAYAASSPLVGVNTLEVVARQAPAGLPEIHVASNAQRGQFFAGSYRRGRDDAWSPIGETEIVDRQVWLELLQPGARVTGPALQDPTLQLPPGVEPVDDSRWRPTAEEVGRLAHLQWQRRPRDEAWSLTPLYLRQSAAEEKLGGKT